MDFITPDIVQWLLMDEKVTKKWKHLARRLMLADYIHEIDTWSNSRERRRKRWREQDKLEMLLRFWREKRPETYQVSTLKRVLAEEVKIN